MMERADRNRAGPASKRAGNSGRSEGEKFSGRGSVGEF